MYQTYPDVEIYGILEGYKGLIYGNYRKMQPSDFSGILTEGGTIIGTSRQPFKKMREPDANGLDKVEAMKSNYKKWGFDCLVILGGNGTHKTANLLSEEGCNVVTLPKTIDNDIWGTDITFGFQSAVNIATNAIDCIHTTAASHSRVFIVRSYGAQGRMAYITCRHCRRSLISYLLPEIPYDINSVVEALDKRTKEGKKFSILAVAEGAISKEDAVFSQRRNSRQKEKQIHIRQYHIQIGKEIEEKTGQEVRITVPGHMQRGGEPCPYDSG